MRALNVILAGAAALLIGGTAANALPVVGNPLNAAAPSLNANLGNFDTAFDTNAGEGVWTMLRAQNNAKHHTTGQSLADIFGAGSFDVGTTHQAVKINHHGAWIAPQGADANQFTLGADWISFADTGMQVAGTQSSALKAFIPLNAGTTPIARYTFEFTTGATMAHLGMWVYADDTAEVYLSGGDIAEGAHGFDDGVDDGRQRLSPLANPALDSRCADATIGCQPGEQAFIEMFWLSPNTTYTIEVDLFQMGGGPSGILFAGGLMNVPEPATLALLGLGVIGMGAVRRRQATARA